MENKYDYEFKDYKEFNKWVSCYEKEGGKITDKIKILLSKEKVIYSSPLEIFHAYEEG